MARIRGIKPDFFLDEDITQLDVWVRMLFVGLWCYADREGRLEDAPKRLKALIFPYDTVDIDLMLNALHPRFIIRYEANAKKYIQINNFSKHQRPHPMERKSEIPPPKREKKFLAVKFNAETVMEMEKEMETEMGTEHALKETRATQQRPPKGFLPNGQQDTFQNRVELGHILYDPADHASYERMDFSVRKAKRDDWELNCIINKNKKDQVELKRMQASGEIAP